MLIFESFNKIHNICLEFGIENYTINNDLSIDVEGNVDLREKKLTELPLKFGIVSGSFDCKANNLTTLVGSPREVGNNFICSVNDLTTLEGSPEKVGGNFYCNYNKLTTLSGSTKIVKGLYSATYNMIKDLYGFDTKGYIYIYLDKNPISSVLFDKYDYCEFDEKFINYFKAMKIIKKQGNKHIVDMKRLQYLKTMFGNNIKPNLIKIYYDIKD